MKDYKSQLNNIFFLLQKRKNDGKQTDQYTNRKPPAPKTAVSVNGSKKDKQNQRDVSTNTEKNRNRKKSPKKSTGKNNSKRS